MKAIVLFFILGSVAAFASQPNPAETPGYLCTPQDPDFKDIEYPEQIARCNRNVSVNEKIQISSEYGIDRANWSSYEFDHLIPLCAGGSSNPLNIWPQPIDEARQKDVLENSICQKMKAGTLTQAEAINQVKNWVNSH